MSEEHKNGRWWTTSVSRRNILRGGLLGGAGLAAAALIGCGDDDDEAPAPAPAAATAAPAARDRSPGGRDRGPDGRGGEADRSANCRANGRADGAPAG